MAEISDELAANYDALVEAGHDSYEDQARRFEDSSPDVAAYARRRAAEASKSSRDAAPKSRKAPESDKA